MFYIFLLRLNYTLVQRCCGPVYLVLIIKYEINRAIYPEFFVSL